MADNPESPPAGTIGKSELETVLAHSEAEPRHLFVRANGDRGGSPGAPKIESYDFRNPVLLPDIELRRLRLLHEDFIRYLNARLSLFLRMEFGAKVSQFGTQTYSTFTDSIPSPTHLCLFKADPLVGVGILGISPHLALTIVDRLLGGRGVSEKVERRLTEIEVGLLEDIVNMLLEEWSRIWSPVQEIRSAIIGHESSGRFLQTSVRDAIVLAAVFDVSFGECAGQIQFGVPYYTVEPVVRKMQARRQRDTTVSSSERKATWQRCYDRITVPVRAQWDAFEVSLREITSLRVGDVIEMPSELFHRTQLLLNGVPKFLGAVGLDDDRVAVQITAKLPPQEEEISHASNH
jgi:flagellar motor switch protein FliM